MQFPATYVDRVRPQDSGVRGDKSLVYLLKTVLYRGGFYAPLRTIKPVDRPGLSR